MRCRPAVFTSRAVRSCASTILLVIMCDVIEIDAMISSATM
jgi:hypothetical protein